MHRYAASHYIHLFFQHHLLQRCNPLRLSCPSPSPAGHPSGSTSNPHRDRDFQAATPSFLPAQPYSHPPLCSQTPILKTYPRASPHPSEPTQRCETEFKKRNTTSGCPVIGLKDLPSVTLKCSILPCTTLSMIIFRYYEDLWPLALMSALA